MTTINLDFRVQVHAIDAKGAWLKNVARLDCRPISIGETKLSCAAAGGDNDDTTSTVHLDLNRQAATESGGVTVGTQLRLVLASQSALCAASDDNLKHYLILPGTAITSPTNTKGKKPSKQQHTAGRTTTTYDVGEFDIIMRGKCVKRTATDVIVSFSGPQLWVKHAALTSHLTTGGLQEGMDVFLLIHNSSSASTSCA